MDGTLIFSALWVMLPAYIPNNAAVVAGGGLPVDGGRTLNGNRLLGDGKTWRGILLGTLAGVCVAGTLNISAPFVQMIGFNPIRFSLRAAFGLAFGAMCGDLFASFLKRRMGKQRGAPLPGMDQLDFVCGALCVTTILAPEWTFQVFSVALIGVVIIVTPLLHVMTNIVAFVTSLKDEPY